jgi:hypothetical protein
MQCDDKSEDDDHHGHDAKESDDHETFGSATRGAGSEQWQLGLPLADA